MTEAIPDEILDLIFSFLSPFDLLQCNGVCKRWSQVAKIPGPKKALLTYEVKNRNEENFPEVISIIAEKGDKLIRDRYI